MRAAFVALAAAALVLSSIAAAQECQLDLPLAANASVCARGAFRVIKPLPAGPYSASCAARAPVTGSLRVHYPPIDGSCNPAVLSTSNANASRSLRAAYLTTPAPLLLGDLHGSLNRTVLGGRMVLVWELLNTQVLFKTPALNARLSIKRAISTINVTAPSGMFNGSVSAKTNWFNGGNYEKSLNVDFASSNATVGTGKLSGCGITPRVAMRDFLVTCLATISIPEIKYSVPSSGLLGSQQVGIRLSVTSAALAAAGKMADAVLVQP